jgi:hypothetical protein
MLGYCPAVGIVAMPPEDSGFRLAIAFTPSYICLLRFIGFSCASIDRAIIGSARQDGPLLSTS